MQYLEALGIVKEVALQQPLAEEMVSALQSVGRIASQEVLGGITIPPFTNSAVDGFALKAKWTRAASNQNPLKFSVNPKSLCPGSLPESQTAENQSGPGTPWAIMTGAPLPLDCDACVKIEDTTVQRNSAGEIESFSLQQSLESGENLRGAGEDFKPGQKVLSVGEVIRAEHLMALASLNIQKISVFKKPRVTLIPTGQELVEPGEDLRPGQIYNSTQPFLRASLLALGCEVEVAPIMRDEPEVLLNFMRALLENPPDLLLTTGAVSMGAADFIRPAFEALGAKILFHRVDIRPGKPILLAQFAKAPHTHRPLLAFGLPGNPVSSVVGLRFFIEPYLRVRTQRPLEKPVSVRLAHDVKKPAELRCFFKASTDWQDGQPKVIVLKGQPSFMVHPLLQASAWAVLPEGASEFKAGTLIEVFPQGSTHV